MNPSGNNAWLEDGDGVVTPLKGNCSLGRSADNGVVIVSERASRRHAIIHAQQGEEYWLADLGSVNGTYLNEHRLTHPTRLKPGDLIQIAHMSYTFQQSVVEMLDETVGTQSQMTVAEVRSADCWLLVADVANFTPLSQRLTPDALAALMGRWVRTCKEQIEKHDGAINKFLGDGFMAYWKSGPETAAEVAAAAKGLRAAQQSSELSFRLVLHHGRVAMGGAASLNEDSLMGPEVNFIFRMEKAAADLKVEFSVSEGAEQKLAGALPLKPVPGEHAMKGFNGRYRLFEFTGS